MCYYNGISVSKADYIQLMKIEKELRGITLNRPVQSGFDYKDWPIIKPKGDKDIEIELAHWEFIPSWCRSWNQVEDSRKKFTTLNAVGEKLLESKLYKDAALKRRCLVLSSGFYEWRHYKPIGLKKEKTYPYYITLDVSKEYFFMAGIWQSWADRETGEVIDTFAIVTTAANDLMDQIHNNKKRMPLIFPQDLAYDWIFGNLDEKGLKELATYQYESDKMIAHTIAKDFRTQEDPIKKVEYEELPAIQR